MPDFQPCEIVLSPHKRSGEIFNIGKTKTKTISRFETLILGVSEASKSTTLESMRLSCGCTYSQIVRKSLREAGYNNVIQSMRLVLKAMKESGIYLDNGGGESHIRTICLEASRASLAEVCYAIESLWNDRGVQECFKSVQRSPIRLLLQLVSATSQDNLT